MHVTTLGIRGLRNLAPVEMAPAEALTLIDGPNAAGKTSLLEGLYLLGMGRSFRTRRWEELVQRGVTELLVYADVAWTDEGPARVGLRRTAGERELRVRGEAVDGVAELARWLPVQLINPDSHALVEGGPEWRRRYLDWGVFHVEHLPAATWQRYHRALRQRNAALRAGDGRGAAAWEGSLAETGERLTAARTRYVERLQAVIGDYGSRTLGSARLGVRFRSGWAEGTGLAQALAAGRARDLAAGYTGVGPHRADLVVELDGARAREYASRGQQKVVAATLILAHVGLYAEANGSPCVVLVDDLPAELDTRHREGVIALLQELGAQTFITALDAQTLPTGGWTSVKRFHVEQGRVQEMV